MSLKRFLDAQDHPGAGYKAALAEIRAGGKCGHWIWYVFPQLSGLGTSPMSQAYGIDGPAEAIEYLRNPALRARLTEITAAVAEQLGSGASIDALMGSTIDAAKLVSSLTLFGHVAKGLAAEEGPDEYELLARLADQVLAVAESEGYPPCTYTLSRLPA